jgi:hypothetical protein
MYSLYKPLGAKGGEYTQRVHTETPPATLERCATLFEAFTELKSDMMEEVKDIEKKLIIPAQLARDGLKPMKKAIKNREDKKVRSRSLQRVTSYDGTLTPRIHSRLQMRLHHDIVPCAHLGKPLWA